MSYFPLDRDIVTSSLWIQGSSDQRVIWLYLMLSADPRTGTVSATIPAIANACVLPISTVEDALRWFAEPDRYSRTKDHDGRRIEILPDGSIQLLTYSQHRDKDHSTPRVTRWRERKHRDREIDRQAPPYPRTGDRCPCCGKQFETPFKKYVVLDHDHQSGEFRAYVCQSCNKLIGQAENGYPVRGDARQNVAAYIERFCNDETVTTVTETTNTDTDTKDPPSEDLRGTDSANAEIRPQWRGMLGDVVWFLSDGRIAWSDSIVDELQKRFPARTRQLRRRGEDWLGELRGLSNWHATAPASKKKRVSAQRWLFGRLFAKAERSAIHAEHHQPNGKARGAPPDPSGAETSDERAARKRADAERIAACKRDHGTERKRGAKFWYCPDSCGWTERVT